MFGLFKKTEKGVKRTREAWWGKVVHLFDRAEFGEGLWDELEELLISADVGVATTGKLIEQLRQRVEREKLRESGAVRNALKEGIASILTVGNGKKTGSSGGLEVILVVGVNGVGKTTSIAKLAHIQKEQGKRVILAAADTFRAAAIDQLKIWGERVKVPVIAHQPGGDPAAVVFDAMEAARKNADVVIVDTAGRLHTKFNLMEELKKVKRVTTKLDAAAPHEVILVLDATTGQNGLTQARYFTEAVGVTGIFLAKLDGTAKGGIVLAICGELALPIQLIGVGEGLEDMVPFDAAEFVEALTS